MRCSGFIVVLVVASFEILGAICFEKSRSQVLSEKALESRAVLLNEAAEGIQFDKEFEDHGLFPRGGSGTSTPTRWQKQVDPTATDTTHDHIPLDLRQVPQPYRGIYKQCKESWTVDGHPAPDRKITSCIISTAVKTFPRNDEFKVASVVAFDILNKVIGVYTVESVLGVAVECSNRKASKPSRKETPLDERTAKCFFKSLVKMHPLGDYAMLAVQKRKSVKGYFQQVAKACHDNMPRGLKNKREVFKYYGQCMIDTVSAKYANNFLVQRSKKWLMYYVSHPDSKFNQERLIDIAELCEDKTKNFPPDQKKRSAFFCFFRSLLSLHPRTKILADCIIRDERRKYDRQDTPSRKQQSNSPSSKQLTETETDDGSPKKSSLPFGLDRLKSSKSTSKGGSPTASVKEAIPQCLLNAVIKLSPLNQVMGVMGSFKDTAAKYIPNIGGFAKKFGGSASTSPQSQRSPSSASSQPQKLLSLNSFNPANMFKMESLQSFVQEATPCLGVYKRDEDGKLILDPAFATSAALEVAKLHPMGALAIGSAEAIANNVSITEDKDGKQQYDINFAGLAKGLGMAAFQSTRVGAVASKFMF